MSESLPSSDLPEDPVDVDLSDFAPSPEERRMWFNHVRKVLEREKKGLGQPALRAEAEHATGMQTAVFCGEPLYPDYNAFHVVPLVMCDQLFAMAAQYHAQAELALLIDAVKDSRKLCGWLQDQNFVRGAKAILGDLYKKRALLNEGKAYTDFSGDERMHRELCALGLAYLKRLIHVFEFIVRAANGDNRIYTPLPPHPEERAYFPDGVQSIAYSRGGAEVKIARADDEED